MSYDVIEDRVYSYNMTHFGSVIPLEDPAHWNKQQHDSYPFVCVELDKQSREAIAVCKAVNTPGIESIFRIQNQTLWRPFLLKREQMKKSEDGIQKWLLYGARIDQVPQICRDNFDNRSIKQSWQECDGIYFAETFNDAKAMMGPQGLTGIRSTIKSIQNNAYDCFERGNRIYAQLLNENSPSLRKLKAEEKNMPIQFIIVARVLLGKSTTNFKKGIRRPPAIDPSKENGKRFDSVIVNTAAQRKFSVIFDKSQCYPDYLLMVK